MSAGPLVLGIDASTTACKAIVWDESGHAVAEGRRPIALDNPGPDAYEQDAETWWSALTGAIRDAARSLEDARAADIVALSIANQRETFVVTDDEGTPLHPALVWMDGRCRDQVSQAVQAIGTERLHALSGKPPCTTPSFYKLLYLLQRSAPDLATRRPRVLDVHGFLAWRLTGRFATSLASADPTGLIDMERRAWAEPLLEYAKLRSSQLPELVEPGTVIGPLTESAARSCGLRAGLPLVSGAGDGQAAGLGAGITTEGRAYLNLGTAIVSGLLSRRYAIHPAFRTLYGALPATYFLETDLKGGTFTITWLLEKWLNATTPNDAARALDELDAVARQLPPGAEGLLVVPYWNGVMNPYWDDTASGIAVGWHGTHGPAHLYRAILEGIALEQRLHTSGVERATAQSIETFVVMGGGSQSDLWCQILSDVTNKCVVRARTTEATALGAGILAAAAAGVHPTIDGAVRAMTATGREFSPGEDVAKYERLYGIYEGIYPALRDRLRELTELRST